MHYREEAQLYGDLEKNSLSERLQLLGDRYFIMVGPLVLLLATGLGNAPILAWTAGILLALSTLNFLVLRLRRPS
ncbi:MAG: hypothetical protein LOX97_08850 [Sphingomonas sp.]|nr:hypothetical protein [Sphingomonas sp.]